MTYRKERTLVCFLTSLLILGAPASLFGDVLAHESFADNVIEDDSPAIWEYSNLAPDGQRTCGATIAIERGDAEVGFCSFAMWSLASVNGNEIEPGNAWSIRARVTGKPTGHSLVGVGIDSYYWSGAMHQGQNQVVVAAGNPFSSNADQRNRHSFFEPWVIQLDVFPDRIKAYRWLVDDPSDIASTTWSNGSPIQPGRPVFWGNWGGSSTFHEVVVAESPMGVGGDFDVSGGLDVADIDGLNEAIRDGLHDPRYNLSNDEVVDELDRNVWVRDLAKTYFGDANLDGEFNSGDLVAVFGAGKYERNSTASWSEGDWNGDGAFGTEDLVTAFADGGYEQGPRLAARAVPEPTSIVLLMSGLSGIAVYRRRHGR